MHSPQKETPWMALQPREKSDYLRLPESKAFFRALSLEVRELTRHLRSSPDWSTFLKRSGEINGIEYVMNMLARGEEDGDKERIQPGYGE